MRVYAVRGATTVDKNEKKEILSGTTALLKEILDRNGLSFHQIISVLFTATKDIDAVYPAVAARELGMTGIPLFCCQEMDVPGSLPLCIRVLIHFQLPEEERDVRPVYLEKAAALRPDLTGGLGEGSAVTGTGSHLTIAIDGPAGAGKSTIAKSLAGKLSILYLDTGAMYRAVALNVIEAGLDPSDPSEVLPLLDDTDIAVRYENGVQRVYLDGKDVTEQIRTQQISGAASSVAVIPEVRRKLVILQRQIASRTSLVMDGRDIGTYVLPDADIKIFLTASPEERARRRWEELRQKGMQQDYDTVLREITDRDAHDSNRSFAPLKRAEDAVWIDTTDKTIAQVISEIEGLLQDRRR